MAKAVPTRTLNPLPFQDIEPHRFEDLVRQLAYDLRHWKYLEATGRGGSDEGLDIRGIESVRIEDDADEDEDNAPLLEERLWVFQCKREKTLAPKRLREVVEESLVSLVNAPYGFVLAVACDVSKKARDIFREEMVARGIEEFALWAKSELEDMLFQPKNDRLLFAYFGLSLQPRRRSLSTTLRSQIAKKKQLTALLGEEDHHGKLILLRDPTDERYPINPEHGDAPARWLLCRAITVKKPGHLVILRHEYLAATTSDGELWDAIESHDVAEVLAESELRSDNAWGFDERDPSGSDARDFWNEYIPESDRAYWKLYRAISFDRILAIDSLGDGHFPTPHILVDFDDVNGPFSSWEFSALEPVQSYGSTIDLVPEANNRTQIFPVPLPSDLVFPLKEFDATSDSMVPLSSNADESLSALMATLAEQRKPNEDSAEDKEDRFGRWHNAVRPFCEWRERVAHPLFSAFAARLRVEGHGARVVVRSVKPKATPKYIVALELVELRMRLHIGSLHNPSYHRSGHVRVSMVEHGGWQLDVYPPSEEQRSRYSQTSSPQIEEMTGEQLEEQVLTILKRLQTRGY